MSQEEHHDFGNEDYDDDYEFDDAPVDLASLGIADLKPTANSSAVGGGGGIGSAVVPPTNRSAVGAGAGGKEQASSSSSPPAASPLLAGSDSQCQPNSSYESQSQSQPQPQGGSGATPPLQVEEMAVAHNALVAGLIQAGVMGKVKAQLRASMVGILKSNPTLTKAGVMLPRWQKHAQKHEREGGSVGAINNGVAAGYANLTDAQRMGLVLCADFLASLDLDLTLGMLEEECGGALSQARADLAASMTNVSAGAAGESSTDGEGLMAGRSASPASSVLKSANLVPSAVVGLGGIGISPTLASSPSRNAAPRSPAAQRRVTRELAAAAIRHQLQLPPPELFASISSGTAGHPIPNTDNNGNIQTLAGMSLLSPPPAALAVAKDRSQAGGGGSGGGGVPAASSPQQHYQSALPASLLEQIVDTVRYGGGGGASNSPDFRRGSAHSILLGGNQSLTNTNQINSAHQQYRGVGIGGAADLLNAVNVSADRRGSGSILYNHPTGTPVLTVGTSSPAGSQFSAVAPTASADVSKIAGIAASLLPPTAADNLSFGLDGGHEDENDDGGGPLSLGDANTATKANRKGRKADDGAGGDDRIRSSNAAIAASLRGHEHGSPIVSIIGGRGSGGGGGVSGGYSLAANNGADAVSDTSTARGAHGSASDALHLGLTDTSQHNIVGGLMGGTSLMTIANMGSGGGGVNGGAGVHTNGGLADREYSIPNLTSTAAVRAGGSGEEDSGDEGTERYDQTLPANAVATAVGVTSENFFEESIASSKGGAGARDLLGHSSRSESVSHLLDLHPNHQSLLSGVLVGAAAVAPAVTVEPTTQGGKTSSFERETGSESPKKGRDAETIFSQIISFNKSGGSTLHPTGSYSSIEFSDHNSSLGSREGDVGAAYDHVEDVVLEDDAADADTSSEGDLNYTSPHNDGGLGHGHHNQQVGEASLPFEKPPFPPRSSSSGGAALEAGALSRQEVRLEDHDHEKGEGSGDEEESEYASEKFDDDDEEDDDTF